MKKTARKICILLLGFIIVNTIGCSNQTPETTTTESESIKPTLDSEYVEENFKVITQEDEKKAVFLLSVDDYQWEVGDLKYSLYVVDNFGSIYYYKATTVFQEIDFSEILIQEPIDSVNADEIDEAYALLLNLNSNANLDQISYDGIPEHTNKDYYGVRYIKEGGKEFLCIYADRKNERIHPAEDTERIVELMKNWFANERYHQYDDGKYREE